MNKVLVAKVVAVAILVICVVQLNLLGALFALIFLGMIPGTDLSIPPLVMMLTYPIAIVGAIYWLAHQPLYIGSQEKQEKTARAVARKRVAKKTSRKTAARRKTARVT